MVEQTSKKGLTKADVVRKGKQLCNWGKWGKDDELGVLNYITPEDIIEASRLVKKGKVFRLDLSLMKMARRKVCLVAAIIHCTICWLPVRMRFRACRTPLPGYAMPTI